MIAHLAEMSERKTALRLGYRSLYDYCARRLNLSEGAVPARVQVANVCRRFPQLLAALAESRVSLTVAGLLAPHVSEDNIEDNIEELIDHCAGKTRKETELYLVALKPKPVFEPSVRKVPLPPKSPAVLAPEVASLPAPPASPKPSPTILQPAAHVSRPESTETTTLFNFRFSADKAFRDKFERLAEVLGVDNPEKNMAALFEKALEVTLDQRDPVRRHTRRLKRGQADAKRPRLNEVLTRHVPAEKYDRVHVAGGGQCEYRGPDGTRCTARIVQVDHITPFGRVPNHDALRLLCRRHNLLEAERVYGKKFMQRKILERTRDPARLP